jgi:hypothetical protein
MKANVTASSQSQSVAVIRRNSHSRYHYKKVLDGRKQPIRGLWKRNGKSIARIVMEDDAGKKKPVGAAGGCQDHRAGAGMTNRTSKRPRWLAGSREPSWQFSDPVCFH